VKLVAEILVKFDGEVPAWLTRSDQQEIKNAIASAVSECSAIEDVASVEVSSLAVEGV